MSGSLVTVLVAVVVFAVIAVAVVGYVVRRETACGGTGGSMQSRLLRRVRRLVILGSCKAN